MPFLPANLLCEIVYDLVKRKKETVNPKLTFLSKLALQISSLAAEISTGTDQDSRLRRTGCAGPAGAGIFSLKACGADHSLKVSVLN